MNTYESDPYRTIEQVYSAIISGYVNKYEILENLENVKAELKERLDRYEKICTNFANPPYTEGPMVTIQFKRFTRDCINQTYKEIKKLIIEIEIDGLDPIRTKLLRGRSESTTTKKGQGSAASGRPQLPLFTSRSEH